MRPGSARRVAVAVLVSAVVLACSEEPEDEPPPIGGDTTSIEEQDSDQAESEQEPDAGGEDEDAPLHTVVPDDPADLDEEYAQAVLDHLYEVYSAGHQAAMQQAPLDHDAPLAVHAAAVHATIKPDWAEGLLEFDHASLMEPTWSEQEDSQLPPDEWHGPRTSVEGVEVHDDEHCLLVEAALDQSGVLRDPPEGPRPVGHTLVRSEQHPDDMNESSWVMVPPIDLDDDPDGTWGPERCD